MAKIVVGNTTTMQTQVVPPGQDELTDPQDMNHLAKES